jgi:hypothetical protein
MYFFKLCTYATRTYSNITSMALYFPVLVQTAWFLQYTCILSRRYIHPVKCFLQYVHFCTYDHRILICTASTYFWDNVYITDTNYLRIYGKDDLVFFYSPSLTCVYYQFFLIFCRPAATFNFLLPFLLPMRCTLLRTLSYYMKRASILLKSAITVHSLML